MKKGSIHVDWVISMGIFLVYLIALLILIKPSYKPSYEEDVLTTMIKDEFLKQNKIDAGFVVYTTNEDDPDCVEGYAPIIIPKINEILEESTIDTNDIYFKLLKAPRTYKAYFLDGLSGSNFVTQGQCDAEIGGVVYYNGLKTNLNFNPDEVDKNIKFKDKFPSSRNYKITIYEDGSENKIISTGELISSDAKIYVLDWSNAKLSWDNTNNEIKRENIIINIRVW